MIFLSMRNTLLLPLLIAFSCAAALHANPEPEAIPLWEKGKAPDGNGGFTEEEATLFLHRPEKPNGAAVVICPGGGYGGLVLGPEGHGIAKWLNGHGITGVVLKYRLPAGRRHVPLLDAQRAIEVTRHKAKEWNCDPAKIGIAGFSAGGHLASTAATHFDKGEGKSTDPVARESSRPDFAILVYPVITMGDLTHAGSKRNLLGKDPSPEWVTLYSNELQVTDETPPAFLAHAKDDKLVPIDNSRLFHEAMLKHKVHSEFLELPSGGHGLNGYKGPMWDAWQSASLKWLAERGFAPRAGDE